MKPGREEMVMGPGLACYARVLRGREGGGLAGGRREGGEERTFEYQNANPRPPLCNRLAVPSSAVSPNPVMAGPCTRKAISTIHSSLSNGFVEKTAP